MSTEKYECIRISDALSTHVEINAHGNVVTVWVDGLIRFQIFSISNFTLEDNRFKEYKKQDAKPDKL